MTTRKTSMHHTGFIYLVEYVHIDSLNFQFILQFRQTIMHIQAIPVDTTHWAIQPLVVGFPLKYTN